MAAAVVSALTSANAIATLALEIGGVVIPIFKGVVTKIESIGTGSATVDYQVLITTDGKELDGTVQVALADLAAVNAELVRQGKPPLDVPPVPPPTP
jgi:hypothetical protein